MNQESKKIRILLADDHSIVLDGLKRILEDCDHLEVVAEAGNGEQALRLALEKRPDVAVVDISMPGMDGLEVLSRLTVQAGEIPVIMLTMYEEEQYMFRALEVGARGYLTKRSAPDQLVHAIRRVVAGKRYVPEEMAEAMAGRLSQGGEGRSLLDSLSTRELQVLRGLALGATNKEIAETYAISVKTVDTYRLRLLKKLNLRNNADLSRFAMQHNLL
ncbi:MAG: response regulator transcription factor [Desulfovermiculus sp.]|nr:response regulator transcription factor [Desulfovermiculus sp.]